MLARTCGHLAFDYVCMYEWRRTGINFAARHLDSDVPTRICSNKKNFTYACIHAYVYAQIYMPDLQSMIEDNHVGFTRDELSYMLNNVCTT